MTWTRPASAHRRTTGARLLAVAVLTAGAVAACGGGPSTGGSGATVSPSAAPTGGGPAGGGPGGPAGGGFNPSEFQKIQECLAAAGISLPTPSGGFRAGRPTGTPTALPTGPRPTDGTRFGGRFDNPRVQAALKACGITLPTGAPGAGG